jgi:hypothetical protein
MDEEGLIEAVIRNRANQILPERLREFGLADAWLVFGSVFQTVWNVLTGRAPNYGIKDYDIFYLMQTPPWRPRTQLSDAWLELFPTWVFHSRYGIRRVSISGVRTTSESPIGAISRNSFMSQVSHCG